ncbi:hypothetical protein VPH35_107928 [Triticum aestivum]|uniref:Uncharacterized protein n=2 Tax=Triticum TaxID=4564 RepID=A0A9R0YC37_TRITD|nr:uncharacterized protein LOC123135419 [Triticum aestivum]VAI52690.1 unnamed protein product [Triticum turgidum subsp. durum]
MLRLRSCVLAHLLSSPATSPLPSLHRLLSAAAASPSSGFSVEEYLVSTCGLTRAQALKASPKLSHLRSPSKPDAVLAFLAGLGIPSSDVAALVARDPKFLCASVERTLFPIVDGLTGLGLSPSEIARLVPLTANNNHSRNKSVVSKVDYYLRLFGSLEEFLRAFKHNHNLLSHNLETVVKRNVGLLQECTLGACDIAKLAISMPRMLTANVEQIRGMVAGAERLGVPRGSGMFRQAMRSVAFDSEDKIAAKMEYMKETFRWSDAEVRIAVSKAPMLLTLGKDLLQRKSEFLISEVGLEPPYLAHRPIMLSYSLEGRLRPRYYAVKFLKENGLLKGNLGYKTIWDLVEKIFMEKYICPHMEAAPHLAEDYAAACRGEAPTRFRFT